MCARFVLGSFVLYGGVNNNVVYDVGFAMEGNGVMSSGWIWNELLIYFHWDVYGG